MKNLHIISNTISVLEMMYQDAVLETIGKVPILKRTKMLLPKCLRYFLFF